MTDFLFIVGLFRLCNAFSPTGFVRDVPLMRSSKVISIRVNRKKLNEHEISDGDIVNGTFKCDENDEPRLVEIVVDKKRVLLNGIIIYSRELRNSLTPLKLNENTVEKPNDKLPEKPGKKSKKCGKQKQQGNQNQPNQQTQLKSQNQNISQINNQQVSNRMAPPNGSTSSISNFLSTTQIGSTPEFPPFMDPQMCSRQLYFQQAINAENFSFQPNLTQNQQLSQSDLTHQTKVPFLPPTETKIILESETWREIKPDVLLKNCLPDLHSEVQFVVSKNNSQTAVVVEITKREKRHKAIVLRLEGDRIHNRQAICLASSCNTRLRASFLKSIPHIVKPGDVVDVKLVDTLDGDKIDGDKIFENNDESSKNNAKNHSRNGKNQAKNGQNLEADPATKFTPISGVINQIDVFSEDLAERENTMTELGASETILGKIYKINGRYVYVQLQNGKKTKHKLKKVNFEVKNEKTQNTMQKSPKNHESSIFEPEPIPSEPKIQDSHMNLTFFCENPDETIKSLQPGDLVDFFVLPWSVEVKFRTKLNCLSRAIYIDKITENANFTNSEHDSSSALRAISTSQQKSSSSALLPTPLAGPAIGIVIAIQKSGARVVITRTERFLIHHTEFRLRKENPRIGDKIEFFYERNLIPGNEMRLASNCKVERANSAKEAELNICLILDRQVELGKIGWISKTRSHIMVFENNNIKDSETIGCEGGLPGKFSISSEKVIQFWILPYKWRDHAKIIFIKQLQHLEKMVEIVEQSVFDGNFNVQYEKVEPKIEIMDEISTIPTESESKNNVIVKVDRRKRRKRRKRRSGRSKPGFDDDICPEIGSEIGSGIDSDTDSDIINDFDSENNSEISDEVSPIVSDMDSDNEIIPKKPENESLIALEPEKPEYSGSNSNSVHSVHSVNSVSISGTNTTNLTNFEPKNLKSLADEYGCHRVCFTIGSITILNMTVVLALNLDGELLVVSDHKTDWNQKGNSFTIPKNAKSRNVQFSNIGSSLKDLRLSKFKIQRKIDDLDYCRGLVKKCWLLDRIKFRVVQIILLARINFVSNYQFKAGNSKIGLSQTVCVQFSTIGLH